jgi:imidazoleglycerol-phosphate dehydratase
MAENTLERRSERKRTTKETDISLTLCLDGTGQSKIDTGIPFVDHMLDLFARHGLFDLTVEASGDLAVDYHHTVEDLGIVLGEAFKEAMGDKKGIVRYGFFLLPMDETLVRVALDLSNRPLFVYKVEAPVLFVRDFNIALFKEFFQAFANSCGANLHLCLEYGEEPHHVAEALFKGFARALDMATRVDPRQADSLPSTKGLLT